MSDLENIERYLQKRYSEEESEEYQKNKDNDQLDEEQPEE